MQFTKTNNWIRIVYLFWIGVVTSLLSLTACQQKELFIDSPAGNIPVNIVIHWDSVPSNVLVLPNDMTVHWYPQAGRLVSSDMGVYGGREWLNANVYNTMCLDFNGNSTLAFRSNGTREDFEVYNIRAAGLYNSLVPQLPGGEATVAEAYPYHFYVDSRLQTVDMERLSRDDTLTVHFWPKDVLKEFTFLIYDVTGAKQMAKNSGAISGMSASYYPASGNLANQPSTILFQRTEAIKDAQSSSRWTPEEKALFAAKNPDWANADTLIGWTRDWIIGKFVTFGPLDRNSNHFRLTVDAISNSNSHYYGAWGYWHGEWENTVAAQIDSAMGKNGTWEEQLAWRKRNGGYDIILYNDHRLAVNANDKGNATDGGFLVGVDDWGDIITVPAAGSATGGALRASINTYATIPDFVVTGIYEKEADDWYRIFNEQYVYKPEDNGSGMAIWDYYPKKYWPKTGEVTFYAYAPAGVKNLVAGLHDSGMPGVPPVLEYTMSYKEREEPPPGTGEPPSSRFVDDLQEDLLVAVQHRTSPQTVPVQINFRHAFSRVVARAKTDVAYSNYSVKVTRVDLRDVYTSGQLRLNADNTNPAAISSGIPMEAADHFKYGAGGNVTLWYNLALPATYPLKLSANGVAVGNHVTELMRSTDGIFVMPQVIQSGSTAAIYVEYDVYSISPTGGEQYLQSLNSLFPLSAGTAFEMGRQYALLLTLTIP